jgi:hypothetical protein
MALLLVLMLIAAAAPAGWGLVVLRRTRHACASERDARLAIEHYAESLEDELFHVRVIASARPGERTAMAVRRALTAERRALEIAKGWRAVKREGRLS